MKAFFMALFRNGMHIDLIRRYVNKSVGKNVDMLAPRSVPSNAARLDDSNIKKKVVFWNANGDNKIPQVLFNMLLWMVLKKEIREGVIYLLRKSNNITFFQTRIVSSKKIWMCLTASWRIPGIARIYLEQV